MSRQQDASASNLDLFSSQEWRLDNLYHTVDEQGRDVPFRMRPAQRRLFRDMASRNIVLKARQLGFTTLIDLMALDQALFVPNTTAAIIAESLPKASEIFDRKIRHPYDGLPAEIRQHVPITSCSGSRLELANGSRISVTVSARSMTCTFLHVSEYGPVSARFPDKALEIMTGSFPAVHAGGRIFVESTAMGNSGCFYDMVQAALLRQGNGAPLLPQEFRLHFFPWYEDPKYRVEGDYPVPQRLRIYLDGLEARLGIKLDPAQRAWYAIQEGQLHEEMWREYPSFPEEAFQVAQTGAYYAAQFDEIIKDRRISTVPVDDSLPVHTAWDLGVSDDMAVWFVQFHGSECRVVDFYAASGEGLPHFVRVLRDRGYSYGMHFAPHDIAVRDLSSGASRLEAAAAMGLRFERVMTNRDVQAGIEAVRELLGFCWFDAARTEEGVKSLRAYRREWDDRRGCYADHPLHDWASHASDAFRTLAVAWKAGMIRDAGLSSARRGISPDEVTSRGGLSTRW